MSQKQEQKKYFHTSRKSLGNNKSVLVDSKLKKQDILKSRSFQEIAKNEIEIEAENSKSRKSRKSSIFKLITKTHIAARSSSPSRLKKSKITLEKKQRMKQRPSSVEGMMTRKKPSSHLKIPNVKNTKDLQNLSKSHNNITRENINSLAEATSTTKVKRKSMSHFLKTFRSNISSKLLLRSLNKEHNLSLSSSSLSSNNIQRKASMSQSNSSNSVTLSPSISPSRSPSPTPSIFVFPFSNRSSGKDKDEHKRSWNDSLQTNNNSKNQFINPIRRISSSIASLLNRHINRKKSSTVSKSKQNQPIAARRYTYHFLDKLQKSPKGSKKHTTEGYHFQKENSKKQKRRTTINASTISKASSIKNDSSSVHSNSDLYSNYKNNFNYSLQKEDNDIIDSIKDTKKENTDIIPINSDVTATTNKKKFKSAISIINNLLLLYKVNNPSIDTSTTVPSTITDSSTCDGSLQTLQVIYN
jgi:hypothetical protein